MCHDASTYAVDNPGRTIGRWGTLGSRSVMMSPTGMLSLVHETQEELVVRVMDQMKLHESTVQQLSEEGSLDLPKEPKPRKKRSSTSARERKLRKMRYHAEDRMFASVDDDVYERAMQLADQNWRRLFVVDSQTIIVKNQEVHK